ncbi:MAG: hypothetical protein HYU66_04810 [Armatimonadetes bacterium]|nr:hypothetical protein [Armatimonadota bacterium]
MASLTIEVPPERLARLRERAEREGTTAEALVEEWVAERVPASPQDARRLAREALRRAGLLAELTDEEKAIANACTVTHEEVRAMMDQCEGPLLSEIVIEQRGPKV